MKRIKTNVQLLSLRFSRNELSHCDFRFKMVHDLVKLIFEDEGEPTQLKNEVGHIFIIDRGESWVCSDFARPAFGGAFLSSL